MEKIAVLIVGRDVEYNQALTAALSQTQNDLFVACMTPERFQVEEKTLVYKYDVLLAEEYPGGDWKSHGKKVILMSDVSSSAERNTDGNMIMFKYRSARMIGKNIKQEYMGIHYQSQENGRENRFLKTIGIVSACDGKLTQQVGAILSQALAVLKNQVIFLNLTEFPEEEKILKAKNVRENQGERTWDDFIYFAVYGRTDSSLWGMEEFALTDESGTMYFPHTGGKNPFLNLEEDEIKRFYSALKRSWRMDQAVVILPNCTDNKWITAVTQNDLLVIVNDGRFETMERSTEIKEKIQQEEDFCGRVLTLCIGDKWDMKKSDFAFKWHSDLEEMSFEELKKQEFWKGMVQMAGYIGGCQYE